MRLSPLKMKLLGTLTIAPDTAPVRSELLELWLRLIVDSGA